MPKCFGQDVSDLRVDIAEYAKQFLGNPYVYGGSSLTTVRISSSPRILASAPI